MTFQEVCAAQEEKWHQKPFIDNQQAQDMSLGIAKKLWINPWMPFFCPLISIIAVLIIFLLLYHVFRDGRCLTQFIEGRVFYISSIINTGILLLLFIRFQKRILSISFILSLGVLAFYDLAIGLNPIDWFGNVRKIIPEHLFYKATLLSFYMGLLLVFVFVIGSVTKRTKSWETFSNRILASTAFLSFIVAIVLLYISRETKAELIVLVLPFGSFFVPILSYINVKFASLETDLYENPSFLFVGAILSFSMGFIFGILSFGIPESIRYEMNPVYYPFMSSSWMVIVSYMFLLDSGAWDPTYPFRRMKCLLCGSRNRSFCVTSIILIIVLLTAILMS